MTVMDDDRPPHPGHPDEQALAAFRVLASGSRGNCSVLAMRRGSVTRLCLIDLGLSPRRTFNLLARSGFGPEHLDDVFLTHLDHDHLHAGWRQCVPSWARVHVHQRHAAEAAAGIPRLNLREFDGQTTIQPGFFDDAPEGVCVDSQLAAHDEHGVAAFRFTLPLGDRLAGSLGFATDLGRFPPTLVRLLNAVDVLAIESNYCPDLQAASPRPEFLKRRITGGAGHLSNGQCAQAVRTLSPRSHVVLLHLSQECNRPDLARRPHDGAPYTLHVSTQERPTAWLRLRPHRHEAGSFTARNDDGTLWTHEPVTITGKRSTVAAGHG